MLRCLLEAHVIWASIHSAGTPAPSACSPPCLICLVLSDKYELARKPATVICDSD